LSLLLILIPSALFVEVPVSIRAAAPTDAELHQVAAVLPTAAGQEEHSATCQMLVNFSTSVSSKFLRISRPISWFHEKYSKNPDVGTSVEPTVQVA
jgi:hypothetical protein